MTTLSIVIPTQGRETLKRAVQSCVDAGLKTGDQIVIVGDTFESPVNAVYERVQEAWELIPFRIGRLWIAHDAGHHCWGHCQLNAALDAMCDDDDHEEHPRVNGDYILCQDDDDVYAAGALTSIRERIDALPEPAPLLFRFRSWWGNVYWDVPGKAIENHIGGHCAVFPNDARLGRFSCRYQGDYDYIRSTLDNWGGDDTAVWVDDVIAIARPSEVTV